MISVWTSSLLTWLYIWEKSLKSLSSSASFLASDYYIEGFAVNDSVYFLKALGPVSSTMVEWLSGLMWILLSLFFFLAEKVSEAPKSICYTTIWFELIYLEVGKSFWSLKVILSCTLLLLFLLEVGANGGTRIQTFHKNHFLLTIRE